MPANVIEASAVCKVFRQGKLDVEVLRGVDLTVAAGESHAILGASGAGKSTLMHLLGGLDHVSSGEIRIGGQSLAGLSESQLGILRNRRLGFIYQFHHLLPEFSALENIAMPLLVRRQKFTSAYATARDWLVSVGLEQRAQHKPGENGDADARADARPEPADRHRAGGRDSRPRHRQTHAASLVYAGRSVSS